MERGIGWQDGWDDEFNHVQHHATEPRFRHTGSIQVIASEGLIAGRISKRLPELITTERGLPALRKATQLSEEAMELLDDKATVRGAKHFGAAMYSVAHWAKLLVCGVVLVLDVRAS